MADASLLSVLAGNDPLSAQLLQAYQGQQLSNAALDPNFGHNEGPFGALAKIVAGVRGGGMTNDAVNQLVQQRAAARPETLAALTNPAGPLAYAAQHPEMGQLSLAQVLSLPPEAVQNYIEAGRLGRANAPGAQPLVPQASPVTLPGYGKLNAPQPTLPQANVSVLGTGRPLQNNTAQGAPPPAPDPIAAAANMTTQQRQALLQNPQQRAMILQRLRIIQAAQAKAAAAAAGAPAGVGNAAQPPI